ncbi:MAG TPA: BON domain-containing protein [Polyangiaceae bacterium]|nr:BON domain-containing protein [Polyangiaceae bacterium]
MGSSFRDDRGQGSRELGRSSSDNDSFYADRSYRDDDQEYGGRGRGSYGSESSGFGAQGRQGNWDASGDRDPYRSGSYGSGSYGSGSRSSSYGVGSSFGSYGTGPYGSNSEYSGAQSRSSYAGRGPKGYTRSDDRIREDVCERLSENDDVDASEIEVQVADRKVTLTGSVENRRMKHIAEDIAESVSGVDDVDNRISVRKPFLKDIADRVTGNEGEQHYAHSGTKNSPAAGTGTSSALSANGRS